MSDTTSNPNHSFAGYSATVWCDRCGKYLSGNYAGAPPESCLCHVNPSWKERAEKAESEVARLETNLRRAIEIAEELDKGCACGNEDPCSCGHDSARSQLDAIKATLNPEPDPQKNGPHQHWAWDL